jgi:hypothetical protein
MAMTPRSWRRWQDWAVVVIGVLTALTPVVAATSTAALWTLVVFGVLVAATGLWSLAQPGSAVSEYVHVALGVLLFISPWVFAYTAFAGAAWASWVAGVLVVGAGLAALPAANAQHRGLAGQH